MSITYLGVFLGSTFLSFVLTRTVRNIANARGWVFAPSSARHLHKKATPRLGGVAIFIAFAVVAAALLCVPYSVADGVSMSPRRFLFIIGPATLVFLMGLYDDFRPLKPLVKFAAEAVAATALFLGGFGVFQLPLFFGSHNFGWLALPATIVWALWITNAFNLLDGVDGLAAGSALFSTLTVFVVSLVSGNFLVSSLTLSLAGAILGFLRFNFNPATIFLGDSGALFIGFMLSALALAGAQKGSTIVAVAIPIVSFGLPVLEGALSILRRFLSGQPLFAADSQHIHHKLLERGLSQKEVVYTLYAVSAACGLLSLLLLYPSGPMVGIVLFVIGAGVWVGVQQLGYHELGELGRVAHRTIEQRKIIVNNLAIRRATDALSKSEDIESVRRILCEAFDANDFDAFDLKPAPESMCIEGVLEWRRPNIQRRTSHPEWTLTLDLRQGTGQRLGTFSLYRKYNRSPLLVDVNLLISGFNAALTDALGKALMAQPRPAEPSGQKAAASTLAN